ncbi:hypothetical protein UCRPA7_3619 [Phaeoacremonium minimum UCRPA7]|uniref:Uncharacterized protein n=1 Tax=Phaeoacremonium minimum (strain UCR-PA7) TaxID=1286976 RepID=R8BNJ7_PHAM7|nr:hypothetical protein UCRPA7_3619 [Phaeoacremonium minimum UCRPA7]EOO00904.1 hypothetical protein UCRPA7_3619 [Phaeoacremonium minimum UCRPA7]
MADAQAPVVDKVDQPSVPVVSSTSDNAPPKDPVADSLGVKPSEEKPAEQAPAAVDPTPSKLEAPAAETAPVQPTEAQSKPAEESSEPAKLTEPAAEAKPVEPASGAESKTVPEWTSALQSESKPPAPEPAEQVNAPAPAEPAKDEPVKDSIIPPAAEEKPAETKPETTATLNGGSKDVEMKDAPEPAENLNAPAPDTAEKPSIPAATEPVAADKRKAETNGDEPKGKKQKTGIADAVSSVVESAKETVTKATNGPSRKDSKKGKKDPAPIGKTLRKTRSQGPVET